MLNAALFRIENQPLSTFINPHHPYETASLYFFRTTEVALPEAITGTSVCGTAKSHAGGSLRGVLLWDIPCWIASRSAGIVRAVAA